MANVNLPLVAVAVRVAIALLTRTFFQPDEFFQSLEVAHHAVYGYGHLTWEWLAPRPIRSVLYPALNVPIYWLLKVLTLDQTAALVWAPKVLHGCVAALTDISLIRLARRLAGERYVDVAVVLSLTSFFHGLSLSRSLSNSAETAITTMALSYFPWDVAMPSWKGGLRNSLILAAFACAIRPTNAIIWLYMVVFLLWTLRKRPQDIFPAIMSVCAIGVSVLMALYTLDTQYYGSPTLTPVNFLLTNASSVSLFYGRSPWHYYLTQGVPILCFPGVVWVVEGLSAASKRASPKPLKVAVGLVVWTIAVYSAAGHKEWRFLHPLLPVMHILASKSLVDSVTDAHPSIRATLFTPLRGFMLSVSLGAIAYVALFHERAQVEVMHYLRHLPKNESLSVGFLMPCHSTPWQAYLHRPDLAEDGLLWALGCEPPLQGQSVSEYKDQTDVFYESPLEYIATRFPSHVDPTFPPSPFPSSRPGVITETPYPWRHEWPQNLMFFGALLDIEGMRDVLSRVGYEEVWRAKYGWEGDSRRAGGVRVWRHRSDT